MNATGQVRQARTLTPAELSECIRRCRETRQWSQEQLAEISGLSVRTVQRVERGEAASLHTLRALARAFEFEDVDALNKPFTIPNDEELKAQKEKFDSEHVTLKALPLTTGKQLARLAEGHAMDMSEPGFEMTRAADEAFAELVDYFREYRDCSDLYTESTKFDVYDEMQLKIDALHTLGVSLRYAERKIHLGWASGGDAKPMATSVAYVVTFPLGREPDEFVTPKTAGIRR